MTKLKPLNGIIVIKKQKESETESGIVLVEDKVLDHGVVVACGPGEYQQDGKFKKTQVAVGDEVVAAPGAGVELDVDGEKLLFITQNDIEGIVRNV